MAVRLLHWPRDRFNSHRLGCAVCPKGPLPVRPTTRRTTYYGAVSPLRYRWKKRMKLNATGSARWRFGIHPVWIQIGFIALSVMSRGTFFEWVFIGVSIGMGIQGFMDRTTLTATDGAPSGRPSPE